MKSEQAVTHGGVERGFKLCRCHKCKRESVCTPEDDYYTLRGDNDGPLYCDRCMMKAGQP